MTDIPKEMLDRATGEVDRVISEMIVADCLGVGAPENPGDCENGCCPCKTLLRDAAEAAIRAALQPLPMESAPKDKEIDVFQRMDNGMTARWTNVIWIRDGWLWCGAVDSVYLRAEDLIGWFPIIGVGND